MDWAIAIPSYKRSALIQTKTLSTLARYDIPNDRITVFVANQEEYLVYRAAFPDTLKIVIGRLGLAPQRNFILDHFPVGTHIVMVDDDLAGFVEKGEEGGIRPLTSLRAVIDKGFAEAVKANCCLWGVYPVPNGFYMRSSVTYDLKFCVGSFWGIINTGTTGERGIHLEHNQKEDYLRTLLSFERDGKVVRINYVSPKTVYYKTAGGMQCPDRVKDQQTAVEYLVDRWPLLVHINSRRRSQYPEILLRSPRLKNR